MEHTDYRALPLESIAEEAISRMHETTPEARGRRLIDGLLTRVRKNDLPLAPALKRLEVRVSDTGEVDRAAAVVR